MSFSSWSHVLLVGAIGVGISLLGGCLDTGATEDPPGGNLSSPSFPPRSHVIYRANGEITVDGHLDTKEWGAAPWTADFVDIEGTDQPAPRFRTRAKMLWDDTHLYVAAELEEPDVWATLTQRDTVIFYDNDFEVFIDPTGDTHNYYELEVNALETAWDLMLLKPYRDGGPALDAWDIRDLEVGVHVDGTLNDPSDEDNGWTVEMALPWSVLEEAAPGNRPPRDGEQWRLNFSRVQWPTTVVDGRYEKDIDTSAAHPEDNWVWSPQGAIDMHRPEHWGIVEFSDATPKRDSVSVSVSPNTRVKRLLRGLYHRQREHHEIHGHYAPSLDDLDTTGLSLDALSALPNIQTTQSSYEITAPGASGTTVHLRQDGKVWTTSD